MSEKNLDRRTLKTRKALLESLEELLTTKELHRITVQEIADLLQSFVTGSMNQKNRIFRTKEPSFRIQRIKRYGGDIIGRDEFKRMFSQPHHMWTSLGRHTVLTAKIGLAICDLYKRRGRSVDEEKVVRIALLHDMGMLDRNDRYRNNLDCCRKHPTNSAREAGRIWKDIDEESLDAIRSHMWPLSRSRPHSREAFILCIADKIASMMDLIPNKILVKANQER